METAFVYLIIVWVGGLVVSAVAKSRSGATEETKSIAVGVYDIITGVMMLVVGLSNDGKYLPKDEQALYGMLKIFGGAWIGFGLIQLGTAFFKKCMEQEIENKVDERLREQRKKEPVPQDGWKCACGRYNLRYVSTCCCGRNKKDSHNSEGKEDADDEAR